MISAPTGDSQKVTGRIIAMVVSGPIPGKTPMAVPITQPNRHKPMFCHVSAMPNPIAILDRMSGMSERRPKRDLDAQCEHENPDNGGDQDEAEQHERDRADVSAGKTGEQDADQHRRHEPERMQQERESEARQGHEDQRPPPAALRNLSGPKQRHRRERRTERDQQRADEPREITRFHRACGSGVEVASEPEAQQAERHVEAAGEKILARKYAAHRPAAPCRPPARASVRLAGYRAPRPISAAPSPGPPRGELDRAGHRRPASAGKSPWRRPAGRRSRTVLPWPGSRDSSAPR